MDDPAKHNDPIDHLFNVFFFCLWVGPAVAAVWFGSPWWLLLYIVPLLIVGL